MSAIDVRLEDVWKQYRRAAHRTAPGFWALQGVSFEVARGSTTGIIGRNGAGKSTLFRLLAGITTPTRGRLTLRGRLAALIEVGSGFHPELTGRENVMLSGAILGMSRADVLARLSSIVDFSGVGEFIDTPVKWYSSGMYVRLGFSVAAHLDPEILLVDEVLAVGDAEFQVRCMERIRDLQRRGVTMLVVSHDLSAVAQLCDRVVLLEGGCVASTGPPAQVIESYHRRLTGEEIRLGDFAPIAREGSLQLTGVATQVPGRDGMAPRAGDPLLVTVRYAASRPMRVRFELSYYGDGGRMLIARTSTPEGESPHVLPPGGTIEFRCETLPLAPGSYYLGVVARDDESRHVIGWWDGGTTLHVADGIEIQGRVLIPHDWHVTHATTGGHVLTMR